MVFEDDFRVLRAEPARVHVARPVAQLRGQVQRLRVPLQSHVLQLHALQLLLQVDYFQLVAFFLFQQTSDQRVLLLDPLRSTRATLFKLEIFFS